MKTVILGMSMLIAISFNACDQEQAPEKIKSAFNQKFPNAEEVDWDMEKNNEWEAEFEVDENDMSATFDQNGQWLETETEIEENELPESVTLRLKNNFKGYEIEKAEYLESPEYKGYELELEGKDGDITVLIGMDGKKLKQEAEEENEDKD